MARDFLKTYLQDHHAAAAAGVALAERALGADDPLAARIAGDRKTLEQVMRRVGVAPSRTKSVVARGMELVGRLKPNGSVVHRTLLTSLVELETLLVGVYGKRALWTALRLSDDPRLADVDFDKLIDAASAQAEEVEAERLRAAREALAAVGRGTGVQA